MDLQHVNVLEKGNQRTKAALSVWAGRNASTRQLSKECYFGRNSRAKNEGEKWIWNVELACSNKVIRKVGCSTWAYSLHWVAYSGSLLFSGPPTAVALTSVLIQHKVAVYCYWLLRPVLQNAFCQQNVSELGISKLSCCRRVDFLELPCSRTGVAVPSSNWKCCIGRHIMWRSDIPEILRVFYSFVWGFSSLVSTVNISCPCFVAC